MPSLAYHIWVHDRQSRLDEIAKAHRAIGGTKRGRRFATNQINQAYAMLLSAEFQGYCRDLHSECVDQMVRGIVPVEIASIARDSLFLNRKLDVQNPNPGNLGSDFQRLGLILWDEVRSIDGRGETRRKTLEELNLWRNAIAHQDFSKVGGSMSLHLSTVRKWRRICEGLAITFDEVMRRHIHQVRGTMPWT